MPDQRPVSRPITAVLQRLLGAVILIAAAALLVPLFLDGQGLRQSTDKPEIPQEPSFDVRLGDSGEPEVRLLDVKGEVQRDLPPLTAGEGAVGSVADAVPAEAAGAVAGIEDGLVVASEPERLPDARPPVTLPAPAAVATDTARPAATPPRPAAVATAEPKKPPAAAALADTWMLQVGAFKDRSNAQKTVAQLQAKGFRASLNTRSPGVFKVQVGPEIRRDRAEALRQRVASSTGLAGVLVRFQP
jgi:DedD protein